jgi:hypothetical protein
VRQRRLPQSQPRPEASPPDAAAARGPSGSPSAGCGRSRSGRGRAAHPCAPSRGSCGSGASGTGCRRSGTWQDDRGDGGWEGAGYEKTKDDASVNIHCRKPPRAQATPHAMGAPEPRMHCAAPIKKQRGVSTAPSPAARCATHLKGRSPAWTFWCRRRAPRTLNFLGQSGQG